MNRKIFQDISKIIERDSKASTYKFALLRGVIDIIQENSPYLIFSNNRVNFPTGLLVEKWMLYYYPILESEIKIPQINGESKLAFEQQFKLIISKYRGKGGFSAFYNDLKNKGFPQNLQEDFKVLVKQMKRTITVMPMKHIGQSINNSFYSIFEFNTSRSLHSNQIDVSYLINTSGSFSIPISYFEVFQFLGSFISGQDSILFKWSEFSVKASGNTLSVTNVLNEVLKTPITEREMAESKRIYKSILESEGQVQCVWTGTPIKNYDVDHLIPFSIWKNNDLWNLLPSKPSTNNNKRDKIPSKDLIGAQKDLIIHYWNLISGFQSQRFQKEIQVSLLGNHDFSTWKETAITQLQNTCDYLINKRGYQEWKI